MHPLGARTREDMKERIMDRTQYRNLAKAWEFTAEHARERESDALTDTRTAADESGQLQGSAVSSQRGSRIYNGREFLLGPADNFLAVFIVSFKINMAVAVDHFPPPVSVIDKF